jgi:hypothetical protein
MPTVHHAKFQSVIRCRQWECGKTSDDNRLWSLHDTVVAAATVATHHPLLSRIGGSVFLSLLLLLLKRRDRCHVVQTSVDAVVSDGLGALLSGKSFRYRRTVMVGHLHFCSATGVPHEVIRLPLLLFPPIGWRGGCCSAVDFYTPPFSSYTMRVLLLLPPSLLLQWTTNNNS